MREDIKDALDAACDDYRGDRAVGSGKPVHSGKNTRLKFVERLRNFLENIPEELTIRELMDELGQ